eukprot:7223361-Prymnesium_polylepis.2
MHLSYLVLHGAGGRACRAQRSCSAATDRGGGRGGEDERDGCVSGEREKQGEARMRTCTRLKKAARMSESPRGASWYLK